MKDLTATDTVTVKSDVAAWSVPALLAAAALTTGWLMVGGTHIDLRVPLVYSGDTLLVLSWIKRAMENPWIFHSTLMGAPFGASLYDYPIPDSGSILALKLLGILSGSAGVAFNVYYLAGFPLNAISAYFVSRKFSLSRSFSFACGFIYAVLPFHFLRIPHLFYTWYFVAPIFVWYAYKIYSNDISFSPRELRASAILGHAFVLLALSCFGVYYSAFGVLIFFIAGVARYTYTGSIKSTCACLVAIAIMLFGVLANTAPNIIYRATHEVDQEALDRGIAGSEVHGLKIAQLLLPRPQHRLPAFAKLNATYSRNAPLVNENITSSLGFIGSAGFIALLMVLISRNPKESARDDRLHALALFTLFLTLFCTIGGFSSIFSLLISPLIRAWNRVSVFLAFTSIMSAVLLVEKWLMGARLQRHRPYAITAASIGLCFFAIWDQTVPPDVVGLTESKVKFHSDTQFISKIEHILPSGAAIYQLPYSGFPETPAVNNLPSYDLLRGYLHSSTLAWSYGGIKGRSGDLFYRALALEPLKRQIEIARKIGFSGLFIDRRGYSDNGAAIEAELTRLLGQQPAAVSDDGQRIFFDLRTRGENIARLPHDLTSQQIMERANFFVDALGVRYQATLADGVDFTRSALPFFIAGIDGLSSVERWGRWSDANISPVVIVRFMHPLPQHFVLHLRAQAFGPNVGRPVVVAIGSQTQSFEPVADMRDYSLWFDGVNRAERIEIRPAQPVSPSALGINSDDRKIAIGLQRLWFNTSP